MTCRLDAGICLEMLRLSSIPLTEQERVATFEQIVIADFLMNVVSDGPDAVGAGAVKALQEFSSVLTELSGRAPTPAAVTVAIGLVRAIAGLCGSTAVEASHVSSSLASLRNTTYAIDSPLRVLAGVLQEPAWKQAQATFVQQALLEAKTLPKLRSLATVLSDATGSTESEADAAWKETLSLLASWRQQLRPGQLQPLEEALVSYLSHLRAKDHVGVILRVSSRHMSYTSYAVRCRIPVDVYVRCHMSYVIFNMSYAICHMPYVICHMSCHMLYVRTLPLRIPTSPTRPWRPPRRT